MTALIDVPIVLVLHPAGIGKDAAGNVDLARSNRGELNYGAPGVAFWECR